MKYVGREGSLLNAIIYLGAPPKLFQYPCLSQVGQPKPRCTLRVVLPCASDFWRGKARHRCA